MSITEYYQYYLTLHKNPKCRLLHFIGQLVTIIYTVWILYNWYWFIIPFIPFKRPIYAKISDWMMFIDIIRGKVTIW